MFQHIVNPTTNRRVRLDTPLGKMIISNYRDILNANDHKYHMLAGAMTLPILIMVTIGNIGIYYYKKTVTVNSETNLDKLNDIDYLSREYSEIAKELQKNLDKAERIYQDVIQDLKREINYSNIEISEEERDILEIELDDLIRADKIGGAVSSLLIPIIIRVSGVSVSVLVGNYIWINYLSNSITSEDVLEPNVTTHPDRNGDWEIVEMPRTESCRLLQKENALRQNKLAKTNLLKRHKLLKDRLKEKIYQKNKDMITRELENIKGQLRNLLSIERTLNKPGAIISAKIN